MAKKAYRVRNWGEYNKSLVQRGSLTFWFTEEVIRNWRSGAGTEVHGNVKYHDMVILCALTLRQLFRLPLRTTEGLLGSLVELMKLELEVPNYTTLCRRGQGLKINLAVNHSGKARHVLVDSTGIQVVGEGEWKKLKHGESRYQLWRKLHLAVDADTHEILAAKVTESVRLDGNYLPKLMDEIEGPISQVTADGAYDKKPCYRKVYERSAKGVFPPQHNAIVQRNKIKKDPALLQRDKVIEFIQKDAERLRVWKKENNYHRRSLVETMMSRMKSIFGDQMRARSIENQCTDLRIRCFAMNRITSLGMPISEALL